MHAPDTQVQALSEAENAHMTHQVQQRLLHLDAQIAQIYAHVERLMSDTTAANSQVTVLVRHLTDPHPLQAVHERLAALGEHVEANREQVDLLASKLAELAGKEQLAELADLNILTVQKIEAGTLNILLTTLIRLRNALDCPWHKLLG